LVSSPSWGSWPDISFWMKVTVLSMWGALSDERSDLSFTVIGCVVSRIYTSCVCDVCVGVYWCIMRSNV
jgi:hypothetical protein